VLGAREEQKAERGENEAQKTQGRRYKAEWRMQKGTRNGRGGCLAPCEDAEWSLLLRWGNLTDRGAERKMRQYFRMRKRYGRTKGEEIKRKN